MVRKRPRAERITFNALEVFCEVVRRQSFSRGGEAFGISQSAASQLVAHLETEVGVELINRTSRPLAPTPEGRTYYLGSVELLQRHRALVDETRRNQDALVGTVRVASIYSVGLHTISRYLQEFMSEHRGSTVRLEYLHPRQVYAEVLHGVVDLGVVSYPQPQRGVSVTRWLEETMVVVCGPEHRLALRTAIRLEELDREKFVAFDADLNIRREIDRVLRNLHADVDIVSEFDNIETIKQALEISRAVSILPQPSIEREVERGTLSEVRIEGIELTRPLGIVTKRQRALPRTAKLFIDILLRTRLNDSAVRAVKSI